MNSVVALSKDEAKRGVVCSNLTCYHLEKMLCNCSTYENTAMNEGGRVVAPMGNMQVSSTSFMSSPSVLANGASISQTTSATPNGILVMPSPAITAGGTAVVQHQVCQFLGCPDNFCTSGHC